MAGESSDPTLVIFRGQEGVRVTKAPYGVRLCVGDGYYTSGITLSDDDRAKLIEALTNPKEKPDAG